MLSLTDVEPESVDLAVVAAPATTVASFECNKDSAYFGKENPMDAAGMYDGF